MTSTKTKKQELGVKGEALAIDYLKAKGYEILTQNYRSGRNEIDIICRHLKFLIFIEVKTRSDLLFGTPEEQVTEKQMDNITEAAIDYMDTQDWSFIVRYDIVSVIINSTGNHIQHFEDAF
ncbi:YraN family protein [Flammeovirga agarivorans]|uniref:UPF0102 protein HGP29_04905 n=1 Tax=Flammeovirga agarivorans TaxID=2726742 RepID=A0A7X8SHY4_9BACT|nr:YraN family protein [Flammeovirga agarivorans]NLR90531.1 YraN family protein [Flammeovirga agarivorans]